MYNTQSCQQRPSFAYKLSAFSDVKAKGRRIFESGAYTIYEESTYKILADVRGDNGTYTVYINRNAKVNAYHNNQWKYWQCTCEWANWAFSRETYHGRMCSHVYAMYLKLLRNRRGALEAEELDKDPELVSNYTPTFRSLVDSVKEGFFAFVDYVTEGFVTEHVSDALLELYDSEFSDTSIDNIVKLAIMAASDEILLDADEEPASEIEAAKEIVKELGIMDDELVYDDDNLEDEDIELTDEELAEAEELLEDPEVIDKLEEELEDLTETVASISKSIANRVARKTSRRGVKKIAGRIFSEEEKLALIEEEGISRHVINGLFL